MTEQGLYTFNEVLDRLLLTDEELLLCKQHRDDNKKLDDMFEGHPSYSEGMHYPPENVCDNRGNIGNPPDKPKTHNRGWDEYYGA